MPGALPREQRPPEADSLAGGRELAYSRAPTRTESKMWGDPAVGALTPPTSTADDDWVSSASSTGVVPLREASSASTSARRVVSARSRPRSASNSRTLEVRTRPLSSRRTEDEGAFDEGVAVAGVRRGVPRPEEGIVAPPPAMALAFRIIAHCVLNAFPSTLMKLEKSVY